MKRTSVPEQAILFYIRKFVDSHAENNTLRVGRYTADVSLTFQGQKYIIEYDSKSQHENRLDREIERDKLFVTRGYIVIHMRDIDLEFVPDTLNFRFDFQDYKPKSIAKANEGINELLAYFRVTERVDISDDLETIRSMYRNYPE